MRSLFFTLGCGESNVKVRLSGSTCWLLNKKNKWLSYSNILTYTTTKPSIFFANNCSGSVELLTDKTWWAKAGPKMKWN